MSNNVTILDVATRITVNFCQTQVIKIEKQQKRRKEKDR